MVDGERHWDRQRCAQRFGLRLPVWYRGAGDLDWHAGTTENISCSGVMIRAAGQRAVPGASVVFVIPLPSSRSKSAGCLRGRCRVVRNASPYRGRGEYAFAVVVTRYRLDRLAHPPKVVTLLATSV